MTSTASAAEFLPAEHPHHERPAAELRHVTSGSRRHGRYHVRVDAVSLEIRRGEVTTLLSRHDRSAGSAAGPARRPGVGQLGVGARRGRDLSGLDRDERYRLRYGHVARVQPGYGIYPKLTVRQNLVIAQRRSGRPADLGWIDQVTEALELGGMLGYHDAPGADARRARWAVARSLVAGPALLLVDHVSAGGAWPDKPGLMDALRLATHQLRRGGRRRHPRPVDGGGDRSGRAAEPRQGARRHRRPLTRGHLP